MLTSSNEYHKIHFCMRLVYKEVCTTSVIIDYIPYMRLIGTLSPTDVRIFFDYFPVYASYHTGIQFGLSLMESLV